MDVYSARPSNIFPRASSSAFGILAGSFPPACAKLGRPPPPPPHIFAEAPMMLPALRPALTTAGLKAATSATLSVPTPEPRTTAEGSPILSTSCSAATCNDFESTPSSCLTTTFAPDGVTAASFASIADFASASSLFRSDICFWPARISICIFSIRSPISSGFTLRLELMDLTTLSRRARSSMMPSPDTASIRRTPDAIPVSETILKPLISARFVTWVPPHSSIETLGTSTTRTTSLYFSPNIAVAPALLASAKLIS
mmetsp:Transcript_29139/g.55993  ORF Transcript_29139/g.55993 Transcript_29139/m.55993 type:complete len:257 (-) Transcript_29139:667-1437(-)